MNSRVIKGTRIKEEFFFSSRKFNTAELLELLSNGNNKNHRRTFHEFRIGISVELPVNYRVIAGSETKLTGPADARNVDGRSTGLMKS